MAIAYFVPGPDMAIILRAATRGWRPGAAAAGWLYAGRLLTGVVSGTVFTIGTAWVNELCDGPGVGARRAGVALTAGFGVCLMVTGLLAQWAPEPVLLPVAADRPSNTSLRTRRAVHQVREAITSSPAVKPGAQAQNGLRKKDAGRRGVNVSSSIWCSPRPRRPDLRHPELVSRSVMRFCQENE